MTPAKLGVRGPTRETIRVRGSVRENNPLLRDYAATTMARIRKLEAGECTYSAKPTTKLSSQIQLSIGAGEGNRTLVCSLGSCRSTIELRPQIIEIAT